MAEMQDEKPETETAPAAVPLEAPPLEQGAIRGAFLARAATIAAPAGGGIRGDDTGALSLKSAFLRRLTEKRSGAVVGDEAGGDAVVRGVYAARTTPTAAPDGRRRALRKRAAAPAKKAKTAKAAMRKAAPAKKGRARAAAKPARPAKRAAKRGAVAAVASRRPAKARRPAAAKRKPARKTRR